MVVKFDFPRTLENLIDDASVIETAWTRQTAPAMDVTEQEQEYIVMAELPGVKKEDVKITYENNVLTLEAERKPYELSQNAKILLHEMRVREFTRSLRLPVRIDVDHISAELQNGVLRVTLPKAQEALPRMISVQ